MGGASAREGVDLAALVSALAAIVVRGDTGSHLRGGWKNTCGVKFGLDVEVVVVGEGLHVLKRAMMLGCVRCSGGLGTKWVRDGEGWVRKERTKLRWSSVYKPPDPSSLRCKREKGRPNRLNWQATTMRWRTMCIVGNNLFHERDSFVTLNFVRFLLTYKNISHKNRMAFPSN